MEIVRFMDQYWRLPGNPGFEKSEALIRERLIAVGFLGMEKDPLTTTPSRPANQASVWYEELPGANTGWEMIDGSVTLLGTGEGGKDEIAISRERDWVALCMNSFPTPDAGVSAPLVYVGRGVQASDYQAVDVKGALVLGDGDARRLWTEEVKNRGAIGVISAAPPPGYTRPDETPDVFQWGGIPYDETLRSFGFKASRRVATLLKDRLARGAVTARVVVKTAFHKAPNRSLVAEIPGRVRPDERIVMVAHVQESGANDNASGCATLLEIARVLQIAIASRAIPPPARTITFIWGEEITESRQWLRADAVRAKGVRYAFSLDMTGKDVKKTGGSFLIEKMPDPSAVWWRPSDPHTEWGSGSVRRELVKGNLLNDLHYAICRRRARENGWEVKMNPFEGGSDHSVFLSAGIPAILDWHFTDRYYHTNLDRANMTSPAEMANVGTAVATTSILLASADEKDAASIVDLLAQAANSRLDLEQRQSVGLIQGAADRAAAIATERAVFDAWKTWYREAFESVLTLSVQPPGEALRDRVQKACSTVSAREWREPQ
jgi:aminopeptidase YwaD